jgi:hypothetical protein
MMEVSEDFRNSMLGGGSFVSQECMCGRVYFCDPAKSHGDYEDGEYERLKKLSDEQPEKYIESDYGCIYYMDMGNNVVIWDCPCGNDVWYENLIWSDRRNIMEYFKNRLKTVEKHFWDLTSDVNSVDFKFEVDSSEKYTYEEFINRMREYKLKGILI